MSYEAHPLADLFPMMDDREFAELCVGLRRVGRLHQRIVLFEGMILDGRNRQKACDATGITPHYRQFDPKIEGDPLEFVLDLNLRRRHLTDSQRASVAAKVANLGPGRPSASGETPPIGGVSTAEAAGRLNVAPRSVERAKVVHDKGVPELQKALDSGQVPVSAAEQIARKPEAEQRQALADRGILPNGNRAIMASRKEPDDSLDFFPTAPFAGRALVEVVLPTLGVTPDKIVSAWECACGEGHIAGVLEEYPIAVVASDIHDYSIDGRMPPAWLRQANFLDPEAFPEGVPVVDWIITNSPFGENAVPFVLEALERAEVGVAMFFRSQWVVEGVDRFERLFRDNPPTLLAFFVERVPLAKGRWDPDGSTATAYCWAIWMRDRAPMPPLWIPPGQREALSKPSDRVRFTAHPVLPLRPEDRWQPMRGAVQTEGFPTLRAPVVAGEAVIADGLFNPEAKGTEAEPVAVTDQDGIGVPSRASDGAGSVAQIALGAGDADPQGETAAVAAPADVPSHDPETGELLEEGGPDEVAAATQTSTEDGRREVSSKTALTPVLVPRPTDAELEIPAFLRRPLPGAAA